MKNFDISPAKLTKMIVEIAQKSQNAVLSGSNVQPPTIREWRKHTSGWLNLFFAACLGYTVLNVVTIFYPHQIVRYEFLFSALHYWAHAIVVIIGFLFSIHDKVPPRLDPKNLEADREEKNTIQSSLDRAAKAIRQFLYWWHLVWFSWFFLYLSLGLFSFFSSLGVEYLWFFSTISNLLNNCTAFLFFAMYYELSESTVDETNDGTLWMLLGMLLFLVAATELAVTWYFRADASSLIDVRFVFSTVSGILTGIATALLTVRFASRIIDVPKRAILVLVIYSVIQPLFPLLTTRDHTVNSLVGHLAINISLYCKATLLVVIQWMHSTHRLTYYMVRAPAMIKDEGPLRTSFVEGLLPNKRERKPGPPKRSLRRKFTGRSTISVTTDDDPLRDDLKVGKI